LGANVRKMSGLVVTVRGIMVRTARTIKAGLLTSNRISDLP